MVFACGNSLVCETMEDARRVAFGSGERRKVSNTPCRDSDSTVFTGNRSGIWTLRQNFLELKITPQVLESKKRAT